MSVNFAIDVKNLNRSFSGKPAVVSFSLQVKRGEIFGFLGPNGSGKTTTIRMLCGLLTPDSGSGQCLGYDIVKQSLDIKRQVGYMTQYFSLYRDLTVYENLSFLADVYEIADREQRIMESLQQMGLVERKNQLADKLSGGWKQRLSLGAALLHQPKLLLLDEPTAGVDPKARRDFWDHIHRLSNRGVTTLVSTHYMDEAERCHRLGYMVHGKLLVHGTTQEIIDSAGLTTWSVVGDNLTGLSEAIRNLPGVEQVVAFGHVLHVGTQKPELLRKSIAPYLSDTSDYIWTHVEPSLEDVFIHLVDQAKEAE